MNSQMNIHDVEFIDEWDATAQKIAIVPKVCDECFTEIYPGLGATNAILG